MIGQTISHYRILEKLGSGGMGVVYKAEDLRLKRPVALKFIPEDLARECMALARFRREAEAASALNHPNICTVHDIGDAGGRPFIAMEYVAGRTLDHLIGRKGLDLADTFRHAIQITDALAKAHAAGIVHRDLKPSNIMVTEDGLVKVLDFGLAKLAERPDSGEEATRAVTERPETEAGTIVGTVAYMSPEQAEGRPVDARSDIFSFGSVLYEMLTGRRAFHGESKVSTLAAILREDPTPASEITARVPAEVDRIVTRCLRKDPQRRWQTMADLRIALEDVKEESESGKLAAPKPERARARRWVWPVAVVAGVAAVAAGIAWLASRRPAPAFELRPERFTADTGITDWPAISPDGNLVAYASDRSGEGNLDVYVQHISVGQPTRLTRHEADDYDPKISPDGAQIVFRSERDGGGLYITETLGGTERLLVPGGRAPSFSPDGGTIAYLAGEATGVPPAHRILLVSARGGSPRPFQPALGVGANAARATLSWSGDGQHLAFTGVRAGSPPVEDLWIAPLDGGPPIATGAMPGNRRQGIPVLDLVGLVGRHVYLCRGSLVEGINFFRAPLAPGAWTVSGPAEQLTSGGGLHINLAAAPSGRALMSVVSVAQDFVSLPLPPARDGATASATKVTSDATIKGALSVSRDGRTAAYVAFVSFETGRIEIRIRDLATGRESVYRSGALPNTANPQISPDGSLVGYMEERSGKHVGFVGVPTNLPGQQVCEDCQVTGFFSDSQSAVICYGQDRLVRQHLSTGAQTEILSVAPGVILDARLSPDDRWVTFVVAAPDRPVEVFVAPVGPEPSAPSSWRRIATGRSFVGSLFWLANGIRPLVLRPASPAWSADGNQLYYFSDRDGHMCVWAQRLDPATKEPVGDPYALYHLHRPATSPSVWGKAMFLAAARDKLILPEWTVTSNLWTAQLEPVK